MVKVPLLISLRLASEDAGLSTGPLPMYANYLIAFAVPLSAAILSILTRKLKHLRATVLMNWFAASAILVSLAGVFRSQI